MLDPSSQSKVTREEWIREQQAREDASDKPPARSAQITQLSEQPGHFTLTVEITHDGTETTVPGVKIQSVGGEFRRHLSREELREGSPLCGSLHPYDMKGSAAGTLPPGVSENSHSSHLDE